MSDASYFGKLHFRGPGALAAVNRLVISDVARLPIRRMLTTFVLQPDGKLAADAYVVNEGEGYLLLTEGMHPSELRESYGTMPQGVELTDLTQQVALVSVDGPFAWELLKELVGVAILGARYLDVVTGHTIGGIPTTIYRAGKTGEFGYLLAFPSERVGAALMAILSHGEKYRLLTCEPTDIDTCKLENRVINVEREGRASNNVLELNMRVMLAKDKGPYIGREPTEKALKEPLARRLIGLGSRAPGEGPLASALRVGAHVSYRGTNIGDVVNACYSPMLECWSGVCFMDAAYAYVGMDYEVDGGAPVRTVSAPFVTNRSVSIRPQEDSFFTQRAQ